MYTKGTALVERVLQKIYSKKMPVVWNEFLAEQKVHTRNHTVIIRFSITSRKTAWLVELRNVLY